MVGISKALTGHAGQNYVMAELNKRGIIASATPPNTPNIDILCSDKEGKRQVSIQVKTNSKDTAEWQLNEKQENIRSANLFYIFVSLNYNESPPSYYIVPSKVVADFIKKNHEEYIKKPKKNGGIRKDWPQRKFIDRKHKYLDRWDLLGFKL